MPALGDGGVGRRIACCRSVVRPPMTRQRLVDAACMVLGTIRKTERGERGVTDTPPESVAGALGGTVLCDRVLFIAARIRAGGA
ncbi:hypothetical protein [Streptomyces sp. NPDC093094]|uniref:hypothetical protein n=1 Tax=Streptomyces sp. NPDC093094 TaxID=3366026 RepID=UPI00381E52A3